MSDGRLNFKATIDDKDFNRKLDGMKKGVDALSKSVTSANRSLGKGNTFNITDKSITNINNSTNTLNRTLNKTTTNLTQVNQNFNQTNNTLNQLNNTTGNLNNSLNQTNDASDRASRGLKGVFTRIASYFGVFVGIQAVISLIRGAFNTIVDFDSRLLNVSKTTGLAGQELKNLGTSLRNLSQELKVISVDKLMEFAGVAGQLGIKGTQEILAFTEALAKLSVTSNIQGEEGAIQIARFLGLVEGDVKNVKDLGDELTNLGNNFKVFEDEIIKNALAIAQNTGTFKLGRQEILAYATSLKEAGVEAELTGASLGRTYQQIEKVLRTGKNIDNLAKITGQSVEDLKTAFNTDPQGVVYSFIKGLNEVQEAGGSVNNAITSIGITATRDLRVIGTLATGGFAVLNRAMNDVKDSSGAMQEEFETASGKISNSIESVKVSWENLILAVNSSENEIGTTISFWAKALSGLIDWIARATTSWKELNRIASGKGTESGFESVMSRRDVISVGEATQQAFLLEQELRKLNEQRRQLETDISETGSKSQRDLFRKRLEDLSGVIGYVNSQLIAYRNIASGIEKIEPVTTTTTDFDDDKETKKSENALKKRLAFLDELQKAENDLTQSTLSGLDLELAKVEEVYQNRLKKAKELKANQSALNKIESLRVRETETVTYKADTEALKTSLEQQKKDYEDFENFKKQVGVEKATEMYSGIIDVSKSYYDVLRDELNNIDLSTATAKEKERVAALFKLFQEYNIAKVEADRKSLEDLINSTQTAQERILVIQQEFAKKREELEKITDENIRNEKLKILEQQEKDAILSIENEIYERGKKERDLIRKLTSYTRRELQIRLRSTEEYLNKYAEFLSEAQKKALESETDLLKSIIGATDQISRQNALLKEKEEITKKIKNNTSKDPEIAKQLNNELTEVNILLEDNADKTKEVFEWIERGLQVANMLADAFGSSNEELQRVMNTLNNLVTSIAQGNYAGAILTVVDWLIQGFKDVLGNDREAERRRNRERLRNQEEYNRMLRDQLLLEIQLNDAYQSRADAIREQQEVLMSNSEKVETRMKEILNLFNEVFNSNWSVVNAPGVRREWDALGLNEYFKDGVEISDELLNKLAALNAAEPLEGTLKELYEELMRLRDEYGSIEAAMREARKELVNQITGTTASELANSIIQGLAEGKRSFSDFADDIEGFLRNAILAGLNTKFFAERIQELQDALAEAMDDEDGLTQEEADAFIEAYMKIVEDAKKRMEQLNQIGIDFGTDDLGGSMKDGIKRITESQADRLTGILSGMQVDVIESRKSLQISNNLLSSSLDNLIAIEFNTRATADNTYQMVQILQNNQQKALGL